MMLLNPKIVKFKNLIFLKKNNVWKRIYWRVLKVKI